MVKASQVSNGYLDNVFFEGLTLEELRWGVPRGSYLLLCSEDGDEGAICDIAT